MSTIAAPTQEGIRAELLAGRLCHDMAGLCGTLAATLELAVEEPDAAAEALRLAHEAAAVLAARLRLLRAAWGPLSEPLDRAAIAGLGRGLPGAPRLALDLSGLSAEGVLPPALARVVLNALLLGAESCPGGGTLALSGDARALTVAVAGRRAGWPSALADLLAAPEQATAALVEAGPRGLQAPLLVLLAGAAGCALRLSDPPAGPLRIAPGPE